MNIHKLLQSGAKQLREAGVSQPRLDSEILLGHVLTKERSWFLSHGEEEVNPDQEALFRVLLQRRERKEPIAYIIGKKEFMGLCFYVDARVLIPRPDTEILVESVLEEHRDHPEPIQVLDLGTGSGAIGLSIAHYLKQSRVTLVDVDEDALEVARKNARVLQLEERTSAQISNCFQAIPPLEQYQIITSNPPYIPTQDTTTLMKDVLDYEPMLALDGGKDGLDFYRILCKEGKGRLAPGGKLYLEIGYDQADSVKELMNKEGYVSVVVKKDLAGWPRVVIGSKANEV